MLFVLAVPAWADAKPAPKPAERSASAQAADKVQAAIKAKAAKALAALAEQARPDPWLVAAELCYRSAYDDADAFARAAPRKAVEKLPAYVASRRGKDTQEAARKALDSVREALARGDARGAVGGLSTSAPMDTVIGVQLAWWRGIFLRGLDRKEDASAHYVAAAEGAETFGWLDRAGRAFDAAGRLQNALGQSEKALALYARGLAHMEAIQLPSGIAAILVNTGIVHHDLLHYSRALGYYDRALRSMERSGNEKALGLTLFRIGLASSAIGDYPRAQHAYLRALPIRKRLGLRAEWAATQINLGNVYHSLCEYPKALEHYELGLAEAQAIGHQQWIANAKVNMAGVYRAANNFARALTLVEEALAWMKSAGKEADRAQALNNLGLLYQDLGEDATAADFAARALDVARVVGARDVEAQALMGIARAHRLAGRLPEAVEGYERAHAIATSLQDRGTLAWVTLARGGLRLEMGLRREGLADLQWAEREARTLREQALLVHSLWRLADAALDAGDAGKAVLLAREARAAVEALLGGLGAENSVTARARWIRVFATGALAAVRAKDTAEALTFLESGRAGALLEQLGGRDARHLAEELPEELRRAQVEARAARMEARVAYRRAIATGKRTVIREHAALLDAASAQVRASTARIQRTLSAHTGDIYYPRAATLEQIQARLDPGQALVIYGFARWETVAVVLTSKTDKVVTLGKEKDVFAALRALNLEDVTEDPTPHLKRLHALLVAPLALPKNVKQVLIAPDAQLGLLPFSLLFDQAVTFTPSGTTHRLLKSEHRIQGTRVLALGDPAYNEVAGQAQEVYRRSGLARLHATRFEAKTIGDDVLLGAMANEKELRAALKKQIRWRAIHLACHGLVDRRHATLSSLALAPSEGNDGYLTALEVLGMDIPADLAVLSACETGKGDAVYGEGITGLMRSFMAAGVPRVLCSLWRVDDEATQALMVKFYELWNPRAKDGAKGVVPKGLPAAEALKRAQAFVRGHEKWKHPYYWAAWVLWGLPD